MDHPPEYYEKIIKEIDKLDKNQINKHIEEISSILSQMNKGIEILNKVGKKPKSKVLVNQKKFKNIVKKLQIYSS